LLRRCQGTFGSLDVSAFKDAPCGHDAALALNFARTFCLDQELRPRIIAKALLMTKGEVHAEGQIDSYTVN